MLELLRESLTSPTALWTMAIGATTNMACALVGCFLVLRRMSLLGDAISHAVLPGIVVGFVLTGVLGSWPAFLGALVFGVLTSLLTQSLHTFGRVPEDASLGVVFTSLFALGVLLLTQQAHRADLDPGCVLYGLIELAPLVTVSLGGFEVPWAMVTLVPVLCLTVAFIALLWKELKIASFDPQLATASGFSATVVHYLLMCLVAVIVVAAFEAVGSILVVAMLIVPAAAAHLLVDRLGWMLVWAMLIGVVSAVLGYLLAVVFDTTVAGLMAVVAGALFGLAVLLAPRHGLVSRAFNDLSLGLRIRAEDALAALYRFGEGAETAAGPPPGPAPRYSRFALLWLWWHGLVRFTGQWQPQLTERGQQQGRSVVRAHRLWEAYLGQHFDLPLDHLHAPAERLEHFIGPALQEELAAELEAPRHDPHGRKIPD